MLADHAGGVLYAVRDFLVSCGFFMEAEKNCKAAQNKETCRLAGREAGLRTG